MTFPRIFPGPGFLIPIVKGCKFPPMIHDDLNAAFMFNGRVAAWYRVRHPGINYAVALRKSGLVCMDVDTKPGKRGQATLDGLTLEHGDLPTTFTVRTPSGGLHYYFERTPHVYGQSIFGPDIDSPNYCLLPGSRLAGMADPYTVLHDLPVAPAPAWFAEYLKPKERTEAASAAPAVDLDQPVNVEAMIRWLQMTPDALSFEGAPRSIAGRNGEKALFDVAAVLKDRGISLGMAKELVEKYYNVAGKCDPLWSFGQGPIEDRADIKIDNAYLYATQNQPGSGTAEAQFAGEQPEDLTALRARWARLDKAHSYARNRKRKRLKAELAENGGRTPLEMYLMRKKGMKP